MDIFYSYAKEPMKLPDPVLDALCRLQLLYFFPDFFVNMFGLYGCVYIGEHVY